MDGQRFDELVRSLTESPSRRSLLGGLTGSLIGGILGLLGLEEDAAARKKKKRRGKKRRPKKCPPGRKRCGKRCCRKGQVCKQGKCRNKAKPPACTPQPKEEACGTRECGTVPNGCGATYQCGTCTGPDLCDETTGQCVCVPPLTRAQACAGRECGTVPTGCGNDVYTCGDGTCPGGEECNAAGRCVSTCGDCENGCCDGDTCKPGNTRQACGHSGGICQTCNPEVECISGECTCTITSCATGCCTIVDGKPFCDNSKRPCGNTCIDYAECCHGRDYSFESANDIPGCWGPETCSGLNPQGAGQCLCGGTICDQWGSNPGCCSLDENGQPFCDYTKRRCGDVCLPKDQCCHDGQDGCNDGVSCTTETCSVTSGTGTCSEIDVSGVCPEACAAGKGFDHYFPANRRTVVCGRASRSGGNRCYCWLTTEGANACVEDFSADTPCRTSSDCAANEVCTKFATQFVGEGTHYTCAPICA